MKLARCAACHDIVAIRKEYRTCACGQLGMISEPPDHYHVRITGPLAAVLALSNDDLDTLPDDTYASVWCYTVPFGDGVLTDAHTICTHCPASHDPAVLKAAADFTHPGPFLWPVIRLTDEE